MLTEKKKLEEYCLSLPNFDLHFDYCLIITSPWPAESMLYAYHKVVAQ